MQQFDLSVWLKDKSRKICTRDGNIVEIIYTNGKGRFPVIVIDPYEEETEPWQVTENGKLFCNGDDDKLDIFFADEEEELTEFERELEMMMVSFSNGNLGSDVIKEMPKQKLHNYARRLLDLARKELIEELSYDNFAIDFALSKGKQDALKDLPKWKKITEAKQNYLAYGYLSHDGYYLSIQELKDKLPKEE